MENVNIFEYASKNKIRFTTSKGIITTEDLWDLNLESLNSIAKSLNKRIKEMNDEEDFINKSSKSKNDTTIQVAFEVVKHVINVKLKEREDKLAKKEKAERREKLLKALEEAENNDLKSKSVDELRKMLSDLDE